MSNKRHFWIGLARCFAPLALVICLVFKEKTIVLQQKLIHAQSGVISNLTETIDFQHQSVSLISTNVETLSGQVAVTKQAAMNLAFLTAVKSYQAGMTGVMPDRFFAMLTNAFGMTNVSFEWITNAGEAKKGNDRRRL